MLPRLLRLAARRPPSQPAPRTFSSAPRRCPPALHTPPGPARRTYARQAYRTFEAQRGGGKRTTFAYLWTTSAAFQRTVYLGLGASGAFVAFNVERVPGSGRYRFNFITDASEAQMARGQYEQLREQFRHQLLPESSAEARRVRRVLQRLLPHSGLDAAHSAWTVDVIDAPDANAFVIPGGHVFVFGGILPLCGSDDGLATVLGHEVAHAAAHHAAEQMSRYAVIYLAALAASLIFDVSGGASQMVLDLALNRPGSRTQEREADHLGLLMMARACFDPAAAISFWERMQKHGAAAGEPPAILSTHPSHGSRVKAIEGWMPEASKARDEGACGPTGAYAEGFKGAVAGVWN